MPVYLFSFLLKHFENVQIRTVYLDTPVDSRLVLPFFFGFVKYACKALANQKAPTPAVNSKVDTDSCSIPLALTGDGGRKDLSLGCREGDDIIGSLWVQCVIQQAGPCGVSSGDCGDNVGVVTNDRIQDGLSGSTPDLEEVVGGVVVIQA